MTVEGLQIISIILLIISIILVIIVYLKNKKTEYTTIWFIGTFLVVSSYYARLVVNLSLHSMLELEHKILLYFSIIINVILILISTYKIIKPKGETKDVR